MERIKEAVERARQERQRKSGINRRSFRLPEASPAKSDRATVTPRATADEGDLETRVHKASPRHLERNRIVTVRKADSRAIAFDMLRTKILGTINENGWRTLAITSPTPYCGKTTVAINLAISIARQPEHSSLLVDFDLRKPKVFSYLGLPRENSLYDCIIGRCTVSEALINPGIPRLGVIGNTRPLRHAAETLSGPDVRDLVVELRRRNDRSIVIFDLPPLLSTDDAIAFLPQVDCVLLVVASGVSTKIDIDECRQVLAPNNLVGIALNKADDYHITSY